MKKLTQTIMLVAFLGFGASANAMLIGSGILPDNQYTVPSGTTSTTGNLWITDWPPTGVDADLQATLSTSSIGTTFTYSTGLEFLVAADILTNGHDDAIFGFPTTAHSGGGHFESTIFSDDLSLNGIDFLGYNITSIGWTINSYSIANDLASVGSSISVYGESAQVPEPATLALFGIGLAGLGFARKKRKSA